MSAERDLQILLSSINPQLMEGEFVFCSDTEENLGRLSIQSIATFRESEGISVIVPKQDADIVGLEYGFIARMIKLQVHSSLNAVGFVAAIAGRLTQAGISVNPVSAYFHDYLFVPTKRADEAMSILEEMMNDSA